MKRSIVICEGRSEFVYIQRLQSFLDEQSTSGWGVPLQFFPRMAKNPDGSDKGGGDYKNVVSGYKAQRKDNKRMKIEVWVDYDIYKRNDKNNMTNYRLKPAGIPDFKFSYHNFEDFLVMHMENEKVGVWREQVQSSGHLAAPLHSKDYVVLFDCIMPGYKKGDLSPDFISKESLLRLKRNLQGPIIPPSTDPHCGDFASFLIDQIDEAFPELLV